MKPLPLFLVYNFGIDLCGTHIGMSHHLACSIKVNSGSYQHRSISMTAQMKMQMFV